MLHRSIDQSKSIRREHQVTRWHVAAGSQNPVQPFGFGVAEGFVSDGCELGGEGVVHVFTLYSSISLRPF